MKCSHCNCGEQMSGNINSLRTTHYRGETGQRRSSKHLLAYSVLPEEIPRSTVCPQVDSTLFVNQRKDSPKILQRFHHSLNYIYINWKDLTIKRGIIIVAQKISQRLWNLKILISQNRNENLKLVDNKKSKVII